MMNDEQNKETCTPEAPEADAARDVQDNAGTPKNAEAEAAPGSPWAEGENAELQAEVAELKDRLLRTMAEMENLRRRSERERDEARLYAATAFARDMIGVGDNLTRAMQSLGEEARNAADEMVKNLVDGVEMTQREMLNVFERHGIKRLSPKGEKFDPNFHQAMFEVENPDVPNGTVLEVMQEGYVIGERVLRPAMVGVAKGGPKAAATAAGATQDSSNDNEPGADSEAAAAAKSHEDAAAAKEGEKAGKTVDRSA